MKTIFLIASLILFSGYGYAQSPWISATNSNIIFLEWDKPIFSDDIGFGSDETTFASSVLFLTGS